MKIRALTLAALVIPASLAAPALLAQSDEDAWQPPLQEEAPAEDGGDLIGRGLGMMMEQFLRDMEPELNTLTEDMSGAFDKLVPILKDLAVQVDDLRNYEAPERLENGDIIIRRRADAPPPPPLGENLETPPESDEQPDSPPVIDPNRPQIEL